MRVKVEGAPKGDSGATQTILNNYMATATDVGGIYEDLYLKSDLSANQTVRNGSILPLPTLGDLRGKILVLRNSGISADFGISLYGKSSQVVLQDMHEVWNVVWTREKWDLSHTGNLKRKRKLVDLYIDCADTGSAYNSDRKVSVNCVDRIVLNHLSGSTGMTPHNVATWTNVAV